MRNLDRAHMILLTLSAASIVGCMDKPMRIEILEPSGALIFDSPKDSIDIRARVRGLDYTQVPHPKIDWSSSNPEVAVISKKGEVTAKRDGRAVITARSGEVTEDLPVVVHFLNSIELSATTLTLALGGHAEIDAALFDKGHARMIGTLTFRSRDPTVATVDSEGLVTARAPGATVIEVSIKHLSATIVVNVSRMMVSS